MAIVSDYISPGMFGVVCTDCEPIIPLEFSTKELRDDWTTRHGKTQHTNMIAVDGPQQIIIVEKPA